MKSVDSEFFLAGGLALLLALLGWGDQIRSVREETRDSEKALADSQTDNWKDVRPLLRPTALDTEESQLSAIIRLLKKGEFRNDSQTRLFTAFTTLNSYRSSLEELLTTRYWLLFSTSVQMTTAGIFLCLPMGILPDKAYIGLHQLNCILTVVLLLLIFAYTFAIAKKEPQFREQIILVDNLLQSGDV